MEPVDDRAVEDGWNTSKKTELGLGRLEDMPVVIVSRPDAPPLRPPAPPKPTAASPPPEPIARITPVGGTRIPEQPVVERVAPRRPEPAPAPAARSCPACGRALPDDAGLQLQVCPHCKKPLTADAEKDFEDAWGVAPKKAATQVKKTELGVGRLPMPQPEPSEGDTPQLARPRQPMPTAAAAPPDTPTPPVISRVDIDTAPVLERVDPEVPAPEPKQPELPKKPGTPLVVSRITPSRPRLPKVEDDPARTGGWWLVGVSYVVAASALGLAIYYRFIA
jgi:hypothetical protein